MLFLKDKKTDYHKTMCKMFNVSAKLIANDSDIDKAIRLMY